MHGKFLQLRMTQTKMSVVLRLRNPPVDACNLFALTTYDYEGKKNMAELT